MSKPSLLDLPNYVKKTGHQNIKMYQYLKFH